MLPGLLLALHLGHPLSLHFPWAPGSALPLSSESPELLGERWPPTEAHGPTSGLYRAGSWAACRGALKDLLFWGHLVTLQHKGQTLSPAA